MESVVGKGLARSIGVSNHSPEKIERWLSDARIQPAVNQVPFRLLLPCAGASPLADGIAPLWQMLLFPQDFASSCIC